MIGKFNWPLDVAVYSPTEDQLPQAPAFFSNHHLVRTKPVEAAPGAEISSLFLISNLLSLGKRVGPGFSGGSEVKLLPAMWET